MEQCPLSEREKEILRLVATGATNRQIARELYISVNTVKVHLRNIFEKLDVQSRTEAAMIAVREGWISVEALEIPEVEKPPEGYVPVSTWKKALLALALVVVTLLVALPWMEALFKGVTPASALSDNLGAGYSSSLLSSSGRWSVKSSMPAPCSRLALAALDGLIYAIGGETGGAVSGEVSVYNPEENRWTHRTPKPLPVSNVGAVALEGKIYVPGGYTRDGQVTRVLEIYDPKTDSWSQGAPLPTPLCGYAITAYRGFMYIFGGWDGSSYTNKAYRYEPAADRWEELTPMPTPRGFAGAGVVGDRIYVVGGYDGSKELAVVEEYAPSLEGQGNPWRACSPMLMGRGGLGVAVVGPWLYAIGGGWEGYLAFNERYDPKADVWTPFETPVMGEWRNLGVVPLDNKIYAIGGWSGGPLGLVEEYQARFMIMLPVVR
ncbi:MAG: hypothetical protein DRI61_00030 [Chloroflexi bacterium]|nr:MAG: hypothetical protein DRI61_00030 [Chloroflexota bacterium]HDN79445.1 helix-turn-helix domain-containing protein [Chloroflexota bacterium]